MYVVEVAIIEIFFTSSVGQDADATCTWGESLWTRVLAANLHRALRVACRTGARGTNRRNHHTALGDKVHRCAIGYRVALAVGQRHRYRRFIAIHVEALNGKPFNGQADTRLGRTARGNGQHRRIGLNSSIRGQTRIDQHVRGHRPREHRYRHFTVGIGGCGDGSDVTHRTKGSLVGIECTRHRLEGQHDISTEDRFALGIDQLELEQRLGCSARVGQINADRSGTDKTHTGGGSSRYTQSSGNHCCTQSAGRNLHGLAAATLGALGGTGSIGGRVADGDLA
jgi:hypothetical protein